MLGEQVSIGLYPPESVGAVLGGTATSLNDQTATFTRATSAFDPFSRTITGAGVRRRRTVQVGGRAFQSDLIEGARTNLLAAGTSERMSVTWTATDITVTARNATAPSGELLAADLITEGSAGTAVLSQPITITAANFISSTRYIKVSAGVTWIMLQVTSDAGANGYRAWFNIATGVVGTQSVLGTGTATSLRIESAGLGWYRIIGIGKVAAAATAVATLVCSASADASTTRVAAAAYFVWGACEEQVAFASSVISNRNMMLQTESIDSATWTKTDTTITANAVANPIDGQTTADLCTEGVALTAIVSQAPGTTVVSGATFTYSVYLKVSAGNWFVVRLANGALSSGINTWVNLTTGAIGASTAFGTGSAVSASLAAVTGQAGWYRLSVTCTIGAFTAVNFGAFSATADSSTTRVASSAYYMYGVQVEYGTAATQYWATTTAVGLRAADVLTVTYSLSTVAATLTALVQPYGWTGDQDGATTWRILRDSPDAGTVNIGRSTATLTLLRRDDAGGSETMTTTHSLTTGVTSSISMVYDAVSIRGYVNGLSSGTPDSTLTPPYLAATSLAIGHITNTQQFYGWVLPLYWPYALTAADQSALYAAVA